MKIVETMHNSANGPISLRLKVEDGKGWLSGPGFDDFVIITEGRRLAIEFEAAGNFTVPVRLSIVDISK